jgi:hypothetical protein
MGLRDPMPFEEERVIFLHELGLALAAWAAAEGALFHLVADCVPTDTQPVVGFAYASLSNLNAKLQFADGAMRRKHAGQLAIKEEWAIVLDEIKTQSGKRNNLAHWQTQAFRNCPIEGEKMALVPWKIRKGQPEDRPPDEAITLMQVVTYRLAFVALAIRVRNFQNRIHGMKEPFPKSAEQAGSLPTIRSLRLRIHGELGHQHPTSRELRRAAEASNEAASLEFPLPEGEDNGQNPQEHPEGRPGVDAAVEQPAQAAQPGPEASEEGGKAP